MELKMRAACLELTASRSSLIGALNLPLRQMIHAHIGEIPLIYTTLANITSSSRFKNRETTYYMLLEYS